MVNNTSHMLTRRTFLGAAAAAAGGTLSPPAHATVYAQPSAPIVTRTDVIYGRVEGSALSVVIFVITFGLHLPAHRALAAGDNSAEALGPLLSSQWARTG